MGEFKFLLAASASMLAFAGAAQAQDAPISDEAVQEQQQSLDDSNVPDGEIIVTARRRNERLQDVPLTVNAVTNEDIQDYNFRRFEDVAAVIPGLTLNGVNSSVRGIAFNQIVSGSSSTIGFYLNDAPVPATDLQRALFDIGQVELLRGPQGTLRGKASPSGSMTLTTRRPDLDEAGGYVSFNGTHAGGLNFNGAVGIPIIPGVLAVRIAGVYDDGPGSARVESLSTTVNPASRAYSWRATALFKPTDSLEFIFTAQHYHFRNLSFQQLESNEAIGPSAQPSRILILAQDRLGLQDSATVGTGVAKNYNLQARWSFAGQRLNYVGQRILNGGGGAGISRTDTTDYYGPTAPGVLNGFGSVTDTRVKAWSHEIRLSSEERLAGFLDYTVGYFYNKVDSPTTQVAPRVLTVAPAVTFSNTILVRTNVSKEESFFGNLTAHIGEKTEISGGARHISYKQDAGIVIGGIVSPTTPIDLSTWIWSGSVKHNFTPDFMAYASIGTSWRPGTFLAGLQGVPTARQRQFTELPAEKSKSYEVGFKSTFLDQRMTVNLSAFYQDFKNFPYSGSRPSYVVYLTPGVPSLPPASAFNFAAGVPATVKGAELELSYRPTANLNLGAGVSYAKSKISNGVVACSDYRPADGVADTTVSPPYTAAEIDLATGGQGVGACEVDGIPASNTPEWSANLQAEYRFQVSARTDLFVRGLGNWYKSYKNEFSNPVDDVKGYATLNIYLGARDSTGAWELSAYAKNITNTFRVLSRSQTSVTLPGPVIAGRPSYTGYRTVAVTEPREFGINLRYAFGSR